MRFSVSYRLKYFLWGFVNSRFRKCVFFCGFNIVRGKFFFISGNFLLVNSFVFYISFVLGVGV